MFFKICIFSKLRCECPSQFCSPCWETRALPHPWPVPVFAGINTQCKHTCVFKAKMERWDTSWSIICLFWRHALLLNILEEPFVFLAFSVLCTCISCPLSTSLLNVFPPHPLVFFENTGEGVNSWSNSKTIFSLSLPFPPFIWLMYSSFKKAFVQSVISFLFLPLLLLLKLRKSYFPTLWSVKLSLIQEDQVIQQWWW